MDVRRCLGCYACILRGQSRNWRLPDPILYPQKLWPARGSITRYSEGRSVDVHTSRKNWEGPWLLPGRRLKLCWVNAQWQELCHFKFDRMCHEKSVKERLFWKNHCCWRPFYLWIQIRDWLWSSSLVAVTDVIAVVVFSFLLPFFKDLGIDRIVFYFQNLFFLPWRRKLWRCWWMFVVNSRSS